MSDLAKWKVHGPVETLRTEFATWDINQEDWLPVQYFTLTSFRPDGKISTSDAHNPDGSIAHSQWLYDDAGQLLKFDSYLNDGPIATSVYFYDQAGRHVRTSHRSQEGIESDSEICTYDTQGKRTKVQFLPLRGVNTAFSIEGTEVAWGAPGATMMKTTYDERDLPTTVLFQDANLKALRHVDLIRDNAGKLLSVEMHVSGESPFPDLVGEVPPEGREGIAAVIRQAFGDTFSSTTYLYDTHGRLIERTQRMGNLGGDRSMYRYDDNDDPVEKITEHRSREVSLGESETVNYTPDRLTIQHARFEYRYDAYGNWTERIVWIGLEPNKSFQRSNIARRAITYHAM